MGDYYSFNSGQTSEIAYAVVEFNYNSNNVMRNCIVDSALNKSGNYIHGVYIANKSANNRIYKCKFMNIQPDPIRIRNGSNSNRIYSNNFINTGVYAYVSDWYKTGESPSYSNLVYKNKFYGKYNSAKKEFLTLSQIALFKKGTATKAAANSSRLKATGNVVVKSKSSSYYNKDKFIY